MNDELIESLKDLVGAWKLRATQKHDIIKEIANVYAGEKNSELMVYKIKNILSIHGYEKDDK